MWSWESAVTEFVLFCYRVSRELEPNTHQ